MTQMASKLRVAAYTNKGNVRPHNQDCVGVGDWVRSRSMSAPILFEIEVFENLVCVVADGVGGHAAGEVASEIATRQLLLAAEKMNSENAVISELTDINASLYRVMEGNLSLSGMGTTVAGVVVDEDRVIVFNIGDSRCYMSNGRFLRLFSVDDTFSKDADTSRKTGTEGHVITQCLGGTNQFAEVRPHVRAETIGAGSRILLCSDGLTDMMDQDDLEEHIELDCLSFVSKLKDVALSRGGSDNISIIVVELF